MGGRLYVGLSSGTSIDGVDSVLVRFDGGRPELLASLHGETGAELKRTVLALCEGGGLSLERLGRTDVRLGRFFAETALALLEGAGVEPARVAAIGSHGQTVWHQPRGEHPFSLQIGDPNTIAQLTGITTVADFRRRDMAAGGQGAPLAPVLHESAFASPERTRAIINVGGIANITLLEKSGGRAAFDAGPANVLMDYWTGRHRGRRYDENGDWAATGRASPRLLAALLDEDFFSRPLPKSTGRELFNGAWLEAKLAAFGEPLAPEDVQATLLELTVRCLTDALGGLSRPDEIHVCGGGVHNRLFMRRLAEAMPGCPVGTTAALGVDPDWVEAVAFAWMARRTLSGAPIDTGPFTGAKRPVRLGGVYAGGA